MTNELSPDAWLFRFRWVMPLTLLPFAVLAAFQADADGIRLASLKDGWELLCLVIAFAGLAVRALAVGFQEPRSRAGDNMLPSTGIHSIVRYPLYLGTYISLFGVSLIPGAAWFVLATSVLFFLWYGRVVHQTERRLEERFGDTYRQWAARIPMFVPNPLLWQRPRGAFSIRRLLRFELNDFYFVVVGFVGLELACDLLGERQQFWRWLQEDMQWAIFLALGTLLYVTFRLLLPRRESTTGAEAAALSTVGSGLQAEPAAKRGPVTRGLRVDGRVQTVDVLENLLSGGNLERIMSATLQSAELRSGDRLVDVGCGSGALATLAAGHRPDGTNPLGEVIGVDATPGMIELARERARRAGSPARFHVGAAEKLPFANQYVDALTSSYLFHHLPSDLKQEVLLEMWRVLKPGGRLVVTDYARPTNWLGHLAAFPMRFNFHEYVRGQLNGELEELLRAENLGSVEIVRVFLGYITVFRIVKPDGEPISERER